jgi:chemotaxis protein methyltransferase CheR
MTAVDGMSELIPIGDADFRVAADFLYDRFGIRLGDQKRALVSGRLSKRLRKLGLSSFRDYFALVKADASGAELSELLNLITTNHSFFFRERDHFDYMTAVALPRIRAALAKDRTYPIRIWSAGCAAGEEVYTIAMTIREYFGDAAESLDIGILATDISMAVLREAQTGTYPGSRLHDLPKPLLSRYLERVGEDRWSVAPSLRRMVVFKSLNLMRDRFPFKGDFDLIFCRNVMIYFDAASRERLVGSLYEATRPGGHLFVGHSESLRRETCPYQYVRPATYRRAEAP